MWSFISLKYKETIKHWQDFPLRVGVIWMKRYRIERFIGHGQLWSDLCMHRYFNG